MQETVVGHPFLYLGDPSPKDSMSDSGELHGSAERLVVSVDVRHIRVNSVVGIYFGLTTRSARLILNFPSACRILSGPSVFIWTHGLLSCSNLNDLQSIERCRL